MKTTIPWKIAGISIITILFSALTVAAVVQAQYWSSSGLGNRSYCSPSLIEFTGTVFSPNEKRADDAFEDVFDLVINQEKMWVFVIEKAWNRSCLETKLGILKDLYPRRLYLKGAKDELAFLQNPDIAGESIALQGYLYRDSRRFDVTNVEALSSE